MRGMNQNALLAASLLPDIGLSPATNSAVPVPYPNLGTTASSLMYMEGVIPDLWVHSTFLGTIFSGIESSGAVGALLGASNGLSSLGQFAMGATSLIANTGQNVAIGAGSTLSPATASVMALS